MTEPYGYDDEDQDDTGDDGSDQGGYGRVPRAKIRAWEKAEKDSKQALERAAAAERRLALFEAGVGSLTERQQKALLASIDGDVTAESVREAAVDLGFAQPPAGSSQDEEAAAMDRMAQASSGATDPGSEDSVARLERAAREGGQAGLLAQIAADGHHVVTSG